MRACILSFFQLLQWWCILAGFSVGSLLAAESLRVGVAQVDITPDYPVRLNGFGSRRTESEGITQPIFAKALAFADEEAGPAILVTTDNLCVPLEIIRDVAGRLNSKVGLRGERFTVTATHTHTAPVLTGVSPTLFSVPIPADHQQRIDRYTREFSDKLEQVALAAVKDIRPARLYWGIGTAGFAINRRTRGGPVDHDLPALFVRDLDGNNRAIYFSYACHCVTLGNNKISGDWAGFAQDLLQKEFPGAIALASVGCGADSNPGSGVGDSTARCVDQAQQIIAGIQQLLPSLKPLTSSPEIRTSAIDLPFDTPRTREEWEARAKDGNQAVAYHAKVNLARLDRQEKLPTHMSYLIQTWLFGEQLAMVFLPGETVVDYSLRLKREFDNDRLWVNGYANEGRCYVPSERILEEGGYEGGGAMIYYDRPQRFAPGLEQRIVDVVHSQVPRSYLAPKGTEGSVPTPAEKSVARFRVRAGLEIELVACEPQIASPVAMDWGADGRVWVCEMNDYPTGVDGNFLPGGKIKILESTRNDGRLDKATVFMDDVAFPTGLMCWGRGVLICSAPDLLYAEDSDGDDRADKIQKLFTGFSTENYQARLNSLSLGLDNWIYGANGLLSASIESVASEPRGEKFAQRPSGKINIRSRDFRFHPFSGQLEPVSGLSQQGRARDDWGNWFGCDNSQLLIYFPYNEYYNQRNPSLPPVTANRSIASHADPGRVYPSSRLQRRYNDPDQANRATSASGMCIYRDTLLGEEYYGNAFTGETVHNLVHRQIIIGDGINFSSDRAKDERQAEFLASTDNWFRPVQIRTGPDGALYIVDMYRFLIEHPRWLPANRLAHIDVRAGFDKGRIYRVKTAAKKLRPVRNLAAMSAPELAEALASPNGTERDRVHAELLSRQDTSAIPALIRLTSDSALPQVRLQALSAIEGLGGLKEDLAMKAMTDREAKVRKHGVRLSERFLRAGSTSEPLAATLLSLTNDPAREVIHQLAQTLGEGNDRRAGVALAILMARYKEDADLRLKVLSSATPYSIQILEALKDVPQNATLRADWINPLVATAAESGDEQTIAQAFVMAFQTNNAAPTKEDFITLSILVAGLERRSIALSEFLQRNAALKALPGRVNAILLAARAAAEDSSAAEAVREAGLKLIGLVPAGADTANVLWQIIVDSGPGKIRTAALAALRRQTDPQVAPQIIARWPQTPPGVRMELIPLLIDRPEWALALLKAVQVGLIQPREVAPTERQRVWQSHRPELRSLAANLFSHSTARESVIATYAACKSMSGKAEAGKEIFSRHCASCHRLQEVGSAVGPDLEPLRDKDFDYFLKNILDPNAVIEPRFVAYQVELKDDRSLLGLIESESSSGLTLVLGGGFKETVLRPEVQEIRASALSMMPDGFETGISPSEMADLIAFLQAADKAAPKSSPDAGQSPGSDVVLRDPASIARFVLNESQPNALRENAINSNPQFASALIVELTRDLAVGTPEEYRRIPWIWRVAIACGKRNDADQIRQVLEVSLPAVGAPLRDWQAVVIGGGIINGISQRGKWPAERVRECIGENSALLERWGNSLNLAAVMSDDEKVPSGTRYDALRMLGVEPWEKRGAQLARYLAKGVHDELQQGAVSGLADVNAPQAATALVSGLGYYSKGNRNLAIDALLRNKERAELLLAELQSGKLKQSDLSAAQLAKLKSFNQKAAVLLAPNK